MKNIILTADEASQVRGESSPGAYLDPILQADGSYILPECVLEDVAHESKWTFLKTLPMVDV